MLLDLENHETPTAKRDDTETSKSENDFLISRNRVGQYNDKE